MIAMGKLFDGRHLVEGVLSVCAEDLQVPGEGGRVAGDVDDAPGLCGEDGFKKAAVAALPGRVHDDDIGGGKRRGDIL